MIKKKYFKILITFLFAFCLFPSLTFAESITHGPKWTLANPNGLGLGNTNYYTNGYGRRETRFIGGFRINTDSSTYAKEDRVFCVEPAVTFPNNGTVTGYSGTTVAPTKSDGYHWEVKEDEEHLKKVLSCWSENNEIIVATQAIVWEIISEERYDINATDILKNGDYKPYMNDRSIYGNRSGITSLYEIISGKGSLFNSYKSILRCAARFNVTPSFSKDTVSSARASAVSLSNYDDNSQTFSKTFTHSSGSVDPKILKYYTVSSSDSSVKVTKTDTGINVTTNKEILKENPVKITLTYTYKDDGTSKLNSLDNGYKGKYDTGSGGITYYVRSGYQSLARGSRTKESYLYVWTGPKPTYQLKVKKESSDGKPMSGVKIDFYDNAATTGKPIGSATTGEDGYAILKNIKKIGKYYAKESETPDGYITNTQVIRIDVTSSNKTNSSSFATTNEKFVNKPMVFSLYKRTIDSEGNEIEIKDYEEEGCTGTYIGPKFTLKKDNKYIKLDESSSGKYVSNGTTTTPSEIKTCNGKFDVTKIESGCYTISEVEAPKGYQLPSEPNQTVCVKRGEASTVTSIYNGVTGVIFNKVTENGNLLDGGKFALQKKINGIYKDILLRRDQGVIYTYDKDLKDDSDDATYVLDTKNGTINVQGLAPGEYRFVEKQAPEGYDIIKEKDSKATFTISDKSTDNKQDYYQVRLVNQKSKVKGSYDSAELIVTIITGRKVANYALIIGGLAILLAILIFVRKKIRK